MVKIVVKDIEVSVLKVNEEDYISFTDMLKAKDGEFFLSIGCVIEIQLGFLKYESNCTIRLLIVPYSA